MWIQAIETSAAACPFLCCGPAIQHCCFGVTQRALIRAAAEARYAYQLAAAQVRYAPEVAGCRGAPAAEAPTESVVDDVPAAAALVQAEPRVAVEQAAVWSAQELPAAP